MLLCLCLYIWINCSTAQSYIQTLLYRDFFNECAIFEMQNTIHSRQVKNKHTWTRITVIQIPSFIKKTVWNLECELEKVCLEFIKRINLLYRSGPELFLSLFVLFCFTDRTVCFTLRRQMNCWIYKLNVFGSFFLW